MAEEEKDQRIRRKLKALREAAKAAVERKYGIGAKALSATLIETDGTRTEIDLSNGGLDAETEVGVAADGESELIELIELIEVGDREPLIRELPPKEVTEAAHAQVGRLLEDLQRSYDAGQLTCLAVVGGGSNGESYLDIAGVEYGNHLHDDLIELADWVDENKTRGSDDEEPTAH